MKTTIYLNDWFYNSGIVGFLRILDYNNDNFAEIKDNYITFETKKLKNFHKYYFKYFFLSTFETTKIITLGTINSNILTSTKL